MFVHNTGRIVGYHRPFLYRSLAMYCSPSPIVLHRKCGMKWFWCAIFSLSSPVPEHHTYNCNKQADFLFSIEFSPLLKNNAYQNSYS